jgi:hypothetical protein
MADKKIQAKSESKVSKNSESTSTVGGYVESPLEDFSLWNWIFADRVRNNVKETEED